MQSSHQILHLLLRCVLCFISSICATGGLTVADNIKIDDQQHSRDEKGSNTMLFEYHVIKLKQSSFETDKGVTKQVIKIRKGALTAIDGKCSYSIASKIQNKSKTNNETNNDCSKSLPANDITQINLNAIIDIKNSNYASLIATAKVLLKKVFNENRKIKKRSSHYATKKLNFEKLKITLEACSVLGPDFNSWCHLLSQLTEAFNNLTSKELNIIIKAIIGYWNFLFAIESALNNSSYVDTELFVDVLKLFIMIFDKLRYNECKMDLENFVPFYIKLLELIAKLWPNLSIKTTERKELESFKIRFLKWFIHSFPELKSDLNDKTKNGKTQVKKFQAYFLIISTFTSSEFYENLHLEEFRPLKMCFEYCLSEFLGFSDISISGKAVGVICTTEDDGSIQALQNSKGFVKKYLLKDKKMWFHFGLNSIEIIQTNLKKEFSVFWSVLRNYVVLLHGNGILITVAKSKVINTMPKLDTMIENPPSFTNIRISSCAYWNLVDPALEGKVVLSHGQIIALAVIPEMSSVVALKIDGKDNLLCSSLENRPEIVLFYQDPTIKENEQHDLIKALPGCIVSEAFDISNSSGNIFDLNKIEDLSAKMLELDPIKISILFCGRENPNLSFKDRS